MVNPSQQSCIQRCDDLVNGTTIGCPSIEGGTVFLMVAHDGMYLPDSAGNLITTSFHSSIIFRSRVMTTQDHSNRLRYESYDNTFRPGGRDHSESFELISGSTPPTGPFRIWDGRDD